jgi:hypothetical protein
MPQENYLVKIRQMWQAGTLPRDVGLHRLDVAHDGWCQHFDGRPCHCNPDIAVKMSLPASEVEPAPGHATSETPEHGSCVVCGASALCQCDDAACQRWVCMDHMVVQGQSWDIHLSDGVDIFCPQHAE